MYQRNKLQPGFETRSTEVVFGVDQRDLGPAHRPPFSLPEAGERMRTQGSPCHGSVGQTLAAGTLGQQPKVPKLLNTDCLLAEMIKFCFDMRTQSYRKQGE
jgi:hypothetical protein